jgi:uncharacterized membrane protein
MSETPSANAIHREFELERMILFSDAVFAIAITLLILEIKFPELPENYKESLDLLKLFRPTILEFGAFLLSFFFIGVSWARHLKMFRYLKAYDGGVIFRNLLSLMFIVLFPFVASGLTHMKSLFMLPYILYIGNVACIAVSNFMLAHYIFKHKPTLSMPGHEPEKIYIYKQALGFACTIGVAFLIVLTTALLSGFNNKAMLISSYSIPLFVIAMRRWLKQYKPKKAATAITE